MKKVLLSVAVIMSFIFLTACGKKAETIDGKWVLTQEIMADGTVYKGDDISTYESYEISDSTATFKSVTDVFGEKTFDLQVEKINDNEYNFKIADTLVFTTGKLEGKYLMCTIGEGGDAVTFVYEKE